MKCICHSAHLVASNFSKLPRQAEDFIRDIYSFFNHSARRLVGLSEFNTSLTQSHISCFRIKTRWLSLQQCVNRILEQWQALTAYFADSTRVKKFIKAESSFQTHTLKSSSFRIAFYQSLYALFKAQRLTTIYYIVLKVQLLCKELSAATCNPLT